MMADDVGGFWLVSQAARLLKDTLPTYPVDAKVIHLWTRTPKRKCDAFYRPSENVIYVVWGEDPSSHSQG